MKDKSISSNKLSHAHTHAHAHHASSKTSANTSASQSSNNSVLKNNYIQHIPKHKAHKHTHPSPIFIPSSHKGSLKALVNIKDRDRERVQRAQLRDRERERERDPSFKASVEFTDDSENYFTTQIREGKSGSPTNASYQNNIVLIGGRIGLFFVFFMRF
jgi:hypothetical protein